MKEIIFILFICTLFCDCRAQSDSIYDLAESMSESVRSEYIKQLDKGKALYVLKCSKCHTTTLNGKGIIPDFSPEQLGNYEFRFLNPTHESDLSETDLSQDDLALIMAFLSYKKKNPPSKKASAGSTSKQDNK